MNRTRAHTSLLVLAIAVLLVVIAVNFYMHERVGSSVDQAVLAHDIVLAEQQNAVNDQNVNQVYQSTAANRARLRSLFIPAGGEVAFIEALEGIGPKAGATVTLSSIDADNLDGDASGTIGSAKANIAVTGSWSAIMRALELTETLPYPVTVGSVTLASSGTGAKHAWQASFSVKAPTIKP